MRTQSEIVAGFMGWHYYESAGTKKHAPTLDKLQTKFWRFHNTWWAILATRAERTAHGLAVFRFDEDTYSFQLADDIVTDSSLASVDAVVDDEGLYVAIRGPEVGIALSHLRFDASTNRFVNTDEDMWRVAGIDDPSVSLAVLPDGALVLTHATDRPYYLFSPKTRFLDLGTPIAIPNIPVGLLEVEISAAVSLGNDVVIMWTIR